MSVHRLPVRPNLDHLKHQAKDLLRDHPELGTLSAAQHALARSYDVPSWPRLTHACGLVDAIWNDDREAVRALVVAHPHLLTESVLVRESNWGPPMTYAANLARDGIIMMLYDLGARDLASAFDRAALQGHVGTAAMLHRMMGRRVPPSDALGGPAYTLSDAGTAFVIELSGGLPAGADGRRHAPVDVVLETDSRTPDAKHRILDLYVTHGLVLPDTPPMAVHRGRIDLLESHLRRDPGLLRRTFRHDEIFPPDLGCHDEVLATHGTPLAGATLLHLAVDYDEAAIVEWLLDRGMAADAPAAIDTDGFGGHTALFATVVSQPNFWVNHQQRDDLAPLTRLLLDRGANPNIRASLRKQLHPGYGPGERLHEYRDVTPLAWGHRFHRREFVSREAMRLIAERGGILG